MMKKTFIVLSCLFMAFVSFGQVTISGKVVDENGEVLVGSAVLDLDSKTGTSTDENGTFVLKDIRKGVIQLEASYIGKASVIQLVNATDDVELEIVLRENSNLLDQVIVQATRAGENTPFSYTNLDKEAVQKRNVGQDIPYLLDATPSVVVNSDAGAGIGYTGIRIRGTDPSRI